eukprot:g226.t1
MANETDPLARTVHGSDPQNLIEQIVRAKIYECLYWKEHCFGLSAESLVDKAVELNHVGGTYGGNKQPCNFLCLIEKMLQIQPDKEIIFEFIKNEDHKYVRLLGAFYLRLVGKAVEIYQYLEPLYNDYRKVREMEADGGYTLTHVDTVVDNMLRKDFLFDISLPRIPLRIMLERSKALEPRVSILAEDFDEAVMEEEESKAAKELAELEEQRKLHELNRQKERQKNMEKIGGKKKSQKTKNNESDDDDQYKDSRRRSRSRDRDDETKQRSNSPIAEQSKEKKTKKKKKKVKPILNSMKQCLFVRSFVQEDNDEAAEIAEANALREKLGLKPLK